MGRQYLVEVNNVPDDCEEFIVARFEPKARELWFWGSWDDEAQAKEIAKMCDGLVVRRTDI